MTAGLCDTSASEATPPPARGSSTGGTSAPTSKGRIFFGESGISAGFTTVLLFHLPV